MKYFITIFLLAAIVSLQYFFDLEKNERQLVPPTVLPAQVLKLGDLGLHSAAASLMWIYTIQKIPFKTPELINTVNNLDPKFSYPYAFAALVLPSANNVLSAIKIAEYGIEKADPDWRIPYYLATTYHIHLDDRRNAALYFDIAANTPGAPEKIKTISARYGTSTDILQQTKQIWISIYESSDDEVVVKRAGENIIHIEIVEALQRAVFLYRERYGSSPQNINDLIEGRILKSIPPSPLGVTFEIGLDGKIIVR